MKFNKRIKTVLYADQKFSSAELELLHTHSFQRLYELHQLGLTDRVFIDASHSRLHHVVGVVEQATNLMAALQSNLKRKPNVEFEYSEAIPNNKKNAKDFARLISKRVPIVRLMALLHDLTHAPYGHTLEDEIHLIKEKHDEPARQADSFYRLQLQFFGHLSRNSADSESKDIIEQNRGENNALNNYVDQPHLINPPANSEFIEFISKLSATLISNADKRKATQPFVALGTDDLKNLVKHLWFAMRAMLHLEAAHNESIRDEHVPLLEGSYDFEKIFQKISNHLNLEISEEDCFHARRDAFMLDVIGNTICADLLDYAKRDALNAGIKLDYDSARIIENFTLVSWNAPEATVEDSGKPHPFSKHSIRTAISLFSHKLRTDVPGELLNLLQVRYYVYERMLFHPTKCIAGAMVGAAIQILGWKRLPDHYRHMGDNTFLHELCEVSRVAIQLITEEIDDGLSYSNDHAEKIIRRLSKTSETSVSASVKQLLTDRVVRLKDFKERCAKLSEEEISLFPKDLVEWLKKDVTDENQEFDTELLSEILLDAPKDKKDEWRKALILYVPTKEKLLKDMKAALTLLNNVISRQFHKAIFRFLPNVDIPGANGHTAESIAKKFLNSSIRYYAEREIERRSGLEEGTIVIHCPNSRGPRKIANILITSGTETDIEKVKCSRLYEIGNLLKPIFEKHQTAIEALQEMYASMWRLVVSVHPRHIREWK